MTELEKVKIKEVIYKRLRKHMYNLENVPNKIFK